MAEDDESYRGEAKSEADRTLLGVAPPRIDSSADLRSRVPVYVRSGTSIADVEPAVAAPSAKLGKSSAVAAGRSEAPPAVPAENPSPLARVAEPVLRLARDRPALSMGLFPVLVAVLMIWLGHHARYPRAAGPAVRASASPPADPAAPSTAEAPPNAIAALEAKPPESLTARELVILAEARAERQTQAARALRSKVQGNPALAKDSAVQSELLRLAKEDRTAREALAAMATLHAPIGPDLLYEAWTGTSERSDATELARALVYSPDMRPTASPALAVALDLRAATTCEQTKAALPGALKDGDRRAWQLLTKLSVKRGCGPKKAADCYPCLREPGADLPATISAAKSRPAPLYGAQ